MCRWVRFLMVVLPADPKCPCRLAAGRAESHNHPPLPPPSRLCWPCLDAPHPSWAPRLPAPFNISRCPGLRTQSISILPHKRQLCTDFSGGKTEPVKDRNPSFQGEKLKSIWEKRWASLTHRRPWPGLGDGGLLVFNVFSLEVRKGSVFGMDTLTPGRGWRQAGRQQDKGVVGPHFLALLTPPRDGWREAYAGEGETVAVPA